MYGMLFGSSTGKGGDVPVWYEVVEQQHIPRLHLCGDSVSVEVNTKLSVGGSFVHSQVPVECGFGWTDV
jgi:hypothetical protein